METGKAAAKPRKQGSKARVLLRAFTAGVQTHQRLAAQAEKPSATAPSEGDLDFAYSALSDSRGVVTAASLHAVASSLNFGWDEEDTRSMLQLFGAGRSLSRAEFEQVCTAVKARLPKR
jgi:hypothetical protein